MRFWVRELAGWVLVVIGLFFFLVCYGWLAEGKVLQTGPMAFVAFIIFRGGIHLLKVALAARVCMRVQDTIIERDAGIRAREASLRDPRVDRLRGQTSR